MNDEQLDELYGFLGKFQKKNKIPDDELATYLRHWSGGV